MKKILLVLTLVLLILPSTAMAKEEKWDAGKLNLIHTQSNSLANWYNIDTNYLIELFRSKTPENAERILNEEIKALENYVHYNLLNGTSTTIGAKIISPEKSAKLNVARKGLEARIAIRESIANGTIKPDASKRYQASQILQFYEGEKLFDVYGSTEKPVRYATVNESDVMDPSVISGLVNRLDLPKEILKDTNTYIMLIPYELGYYKTYTIKNSNNEEKQVIVVGTIPLKIKKDDDNKLGMWDEKAFVVHEVGHVIANLTMPRDNTAPEWQQYAGFYGQKVGNKLDMKQLETLQHNFAEDFREAYGTLTNGNDSIYRCGKVDTWSRTSDDEAIDFVKSKVKLLMPTTSEF